MVCSTCKESRSFANGGRTDDFHHQLFNVKKDHRVPLTLCFVHSRDLYLMGERRFLSVYKEFALQVTGKLEKDEESEGLF